MWEADRLLQEEEEEYLDVSSSSTRHCPCTAIPSTNRLFHSSTLCLTRARAACDGIFQSEEVRGVGGGRSKEAAMEAVPLMHKSQRN